VQYVKWLWGTIHLDLAVRSGCQPVLTEIGDRLPATVELLGLSFLLALLCAIHWDHRGGQTVFDRRLSLYRLSYIGISMPVFWFAEMLILFFAVQHGCSPPAGSKRKACR